MLVPSFVFNSVVTSGRGLLFVLSLVCGGLVGLNSAPAWAQSGGGDAQQTVEVTYRVYAEDKTPREAREQAIKRAQAEAVRRVVGTQVQAEQRTSTVKSGDEMVDRFSQIVRTGASGRVVDYEVLEEERLERAGTLFFKVTIRATVAPEQGRPDPTFNVDLSLNEADGVYLHREGKQKSQELVVEMTPTKDAYFTLFNVTPDTIRVMWPNARLKDTFVPADSTVEFVPPDLRRLGLRWRVQVPPGETTVTERVVAVATKKNIPFRPVPNWEVEGGEVKTAGASVDALNRWLVEIPLDQRALATATYTVKRVEAE